MMKINVPAQELGEYQVRLMRDADAPGVVALYRAIYGEHYPIKEMYDADYIIKQQEAEMMYRVIVADAAGNILGHSGLYRLQGAYTGLYEGGQGMVRAEARSKGFNNAIYSYIMQILLPAVGVEEIWGESVTNHVFMQKTAISIGTKETGIELELMPGESYEAEKSASGRVSAVVACACVKEKPHTVFLPAPYADILKKIYVHAKRDRQLKTAAGVLPQKVKTSYFDAFIAGAGVLRVFVHEAGADAGETMAGLVKKYLDAGAVVLQVFLPLNQPWSGALTEILNRLGFFFAAVAPRWFDADGLLMQKLVNPTNYDEIRLYSDFAKEMLQFIIEDRNRAEALALI
ncbi:MAG: hypothetical protein PHF23_05575 [Smithellaceae bacterium]|nr:hypothetical protein [Smithellaceae bacterium]